MERHGAHDLATPWERRTPGELIAHIISRYHETLRRDVPELIAAATTVERVHAGLPDVPCGLAGALDELWSEMQLHMMKEERVLFPMIREGVRGSQVYMPIRVMEQEHEAHREALAQIQKLAHAYQPPPHACGTWRGLYEQLAIFDAELVEHIRLENEVLFPRASRE